MLRRLLACAAAVFFASAVDAAPTALTPPAINWGGPLGVITPVQNIGTDSGSGLPCIVGSAPTCAMSVTGAGGGAAGPLGSTSTDRSGTVTLGGTYQTTLTANASRVGCLYQNPTTATEILKIKVGTMASPFEIAAGGSFSCGQGSMVVTDAITVTAATTAHAFIGVSQP